jgi:hypothetical protein
MDVIGFLCVSLGSITVQLHDSLGKRHACACSEAGQTFGKRRRAKPECKNGIRNRGLKEWLRLGSQRTPCRIFRKTIRLEIVKRIAGSPVRSSKHSPRKRKNCGTPVGHSGRKTLRREQCGVQIRY